MTETRTPRTFEDRRWRTAIIVAIVVVAAVLAGVFYSRFGKDLSIVQTPLIGTQVPPLELAYLEQEGSLAFDDLRGTVLVINFWASYCIPCRFEHPVLAAAARDYEAQGVHFIGVTYEEDPPASVRFLDEFGRPPNTSYLKDPTNRSVVEFGIFGIPETYVVDRQGTIVWKFNGEITEGPLRTILDQVLAGQTPTL